MNSSEFLLAFLCVGLAAWTIIFIVLELMESADKSEGSLTASQRLLKMAKEGNKWAKAYILALPVFLILIGVWLIFHFEGLCINFNLFCEVDI